MGMKGPKHSYLEKKATKAGKGERKGSGATDMLSIASLKAENTTIVFQTLRTQLYHKIEK